MIIITKPKGFSVIQFTESNINEVVKFTKNSLFKSESLPINYYICNGKEVISIKMGDYLLKNKSDMLFIASKEEYEKHYCVEIGGDNTVLSMCELDAFCNNPSFTITANSCEFTDKFKKLIEMK